MQEIIDVKSVNERIEEENAQRERDLFRYLDSFKQENPVLIDTCNAAAEQMKKDREAEEAADVARAQEEAAAQVAAAYRNKYGKSTREDADKGYKELLKSLF